MEKEEFRICPFCKSKIPASLDECPVCHRVIVERFENEQNNENVKSNLRDDFFYQNIPETNQVRKHHFPKFMKRIPWILAAIAAITILSILIFRPRPVSYQLGYIDQKFNISSDEAMSIINDAAQRWNNEAQKNLLEYNPHGRVTINFIYDYRQEYINAKKKIESEYSYLSANKNLLDTEIQSINSKKSQIAYEYERLDNEINSLNSDLSDYNSRVNYWNHSGGAPTYVYSELENERKELNTRKSQIQAKLNELQGRENELNKEVEKYDKKVDEYNRKVNEESAKMDVIYNQFLKNQNYSEETMMGEYSEHAITIYAFEDSQTLRLILMHEFGHALGAGHAKSKNSIMYPIINDITLNISNPIPSIEDLSLISGHP
jgi:peptidoglycan hydrolase CwlO-like protein